MRLMARSKPPALPRPPVAAPTASQGDQQPPEVASEVVPPAGEWDAQSIIERIADGTHATVIAQELGVSTYRLFAFLGRPEHLTQWQASKLHRAHVLVDRIQQITTAVIEGRIDPNAARVAMDALKWLAGKLNQDYGDKQQIEVTNVTPAEALKRLAQQATPPLPPMPVPVEPEQQHPAPRSVQ